MGIFARLFGARSEDDKPVEQAVIVHFAYIGSTDLQPLYELEAQLEARLEVTGAGELDGNEVAADGSDGYLYLYGPDADALFGAIKQTLEACPFMRGAAVRLRYGPPADGVLEHEVQLAT